MTEPGLLGHLYEIDPDCRNVFMSPGDVIIFHSFTHHAGGDRFVFFNTSQLPIDPFFPLPLPLQNS